MTGSPIVCVCGAEGCISVDDMIWLCIPCAEIIGDEFRNAGFASETSSDADAPVSSPIAPLCETGAIFSKLDTLIDFTGLDRSATGTGSRKSPGEKDCASFSSSDRSLVGLREGRLTERSPAESDGAAAAGYCVPFKVIDSRVNSVSGTATATVLDVMKATTLRIAADSSIQAISPSPVSGA